MAAEAMGVGRRHLLLEDLVWTGGVEDQVQAAGVVVEEAGERATLARALGVPVAVVVMVDARFLLAAGVVELRLVRLVAAAKEKTTGSECI